MSTAVPLDVDAPRLLLVDLSAIFHQAYHVSGGEDADAASRKTVQRVRGIATSFERLAICGDAPRNWRHDKLSTYKATRAAKPPEFRAQFERAVHQLRLDGFPMWIVDGFEADDVIASATAVARGRGMHVVVMTHDKDLSQLLIDPGVSILDISTGQIRTADDVRKDPGKAPASSANGFGVDPSQLGDWLAIVGDTSDNVPGVQGIGAKGATALLTRFGSIDGIMAAVEAPDRLLEWNLRASNGEAIEEIGPKPEVPDPPIKPAALAALKSGEKQLRLSRELIGLRADVPIPFDEALAERKPQALPTHTPMPTFDENEDLRPMMINPNAENQNATPEPANGNGAPPPPDSQPEAPRTVVEPPLPQAAVPVQSQQASTAPIATEAGFDPRATPSALMSPAARPAIWQHTLEPTTLNDALKISRALHESRLFSHFGSAEGIFAAHLIARAHGIETMKVLMPGMVHNIKGKLSMSAQLMVGLVLRSGVCEYFDLVESTPKRAVYVTKRKGAKHEVKFEFTIEEAQSAGYLGKADSAWSKTPKTMLRHRCETELCRAVYPDVVGGLYSAEELENAA